MIGGDVGIGLQELLLLFYLKAVLNRFGLQKDGLFLDLFYSVPVYFFQSGLFLDFGYCVFVLLLVLSQSVF